MKAHELAKKLMELPEDTIVVTRSFGDVWMSVNRPMQIEIVDTESEDHIGLCYYRYDEKWHKARPKLNGFWIT